MGNGRPFKGASKGRPCPVCEGTSHCMLFDEPQEMHFGKERDGTPIARVISGLVICMGAYRKGIWAEGGQRRESNGYVQHGIYVHRRGSPAPEFMATKPGPNGGTRWYPRGEDQQDGNTVKRTPAEQAEYEAKKAQKARGNAEDDAAKRARWCSRYVTASRAKGQNHPNLVAYFEERGIPVALLPHGRLPGCLAMGENIPREVPHEDAEEDPMFGVAGPAMLAAIIMPDGEHWNTHRTYLDLGGAPKKRASGIVRMINGTPGVGSAIRLSEDFHEGPDGLSVLGIGEGIESSAAALVGVRSIGLAHWDVWSTRAADGMMNFELPEGITAAEGGPVGTLVIFADLDRVQRKDPKNPKGWHRPGVEAARKCAERLQAKHPELTILLSMATPEWLPEGVSPGAFDGLGELAPKADGTARKSIDPDDALAILQAQRTHGDKVAAARILGEGLRASLRPWRDVCEQIDQAREAAEKAMGVKVTGAMPARGRGEEGSDEATERRSDEGGRTPDEEVGELGPCDYRLLPDCATARARIVLDEKFRPSGEWHREMGDHCMDPTRPHNLRARKADAGERWSLIYWLDGEQWMVFDGTCYRPMREEELCAMVRDFLAPFKTPRKKDQPKPCAISGGAVKDVVDAMKTEAMLRSERLPAWAPATFDEAGRPMWHTVWRSPVASGPDVIPTKGGLLEVEAIKARKVTMRPLTPRYVCLSVLPHVVPVDRLQAALDADASGELRLCDLAGELSPAWTAFLAEQGGDDDVWHRGAQRFGGLLLTSDISFGQALLCIGISGSGKGTFVQGLRTCHDIRNYAVTTYDGITDKFEAAKWLGRGWLFMDEMQAGKYSDRAATASRLKSIIVGEPITVDIKNKEGIATFEHTLRVVMASDRMPELIDTAAAMRRRLIVLPFRKAYRGEGDPNIRARISKEGLGILVWAIGGMIDLYKAGKLEMPEAGKTYLERFARACSKPYAFLQDACVVDECSAVTDRMLDTMYGRWCKHHRCELPGRDKVFEGFAAIIDGLQRVKLADWARRQGLELSEHELYDTRGRDVWVYVGVRPRLEADARTDQRAALVLNETTARRAKVGGGWALDLSTVAAMEFDEVAEEREDQQERF